MLNKPLGLFLPFLLASSVLCSNRDSTSPELVEEILTDLPYHRLTEGGEECFDWSDDGRSILVKRAEEIWSIDAVSGLFTTRHTIADSFDLNNVIWFGTQYINHPSNNSILFFAQKKATRAAGIYLSDPGHGFELLREPTQDYILSFSATGNCMIIVLYEASFGRRHGNTFRVWHRDSGVIATFSPPELGIESYPPSIVKVDPEGSYFDYSGNGWDMEKYQILRWNFADNTIAVLWEGDKNIIGFDCAPDDKKYIISMSEEVNGKIRGNVYLHNLDRPDTTYQITTLTEGFIRRPVFSPDGTKVAFDVQTGPLGRGIYVVELTELLRASSK